MNLPASTIIQSTIQLFLSKMLNLISEKTAMKNANYITSIITLVVALLLPIQLTVPGFAQEKLDSWQASYSPLEGIGKEKEVMRLSLIHI